MPLGRLRTGVGVDLGDDERHVGVHPERAGVVDDDGARARRRSAPTAAETSSGTSNIATSTPSKTSGASAWTTTSSPRTRSTLPAERAEATSRISPQTSSRWSRGSRASRCRRRRWRRRRRAWACASAAHRPGASVDHGLALGGVEAERRVDGADRVVELVVAGDDRDADLGGRDHLDVDAGVGERLEERGRDAGVRRACRRRPARACRCGRRRRSDVEADLRPGSRLSACIAGLRRRSWAA